MIVNDKRFYKLDLIETISQRNVTKYYFKLVFVRLFYHLYSNIKWHVLFCLQKETTNQNVARKISWIEGIVCFNIAFNVKHKPLDFT